VLVAYACALVRACARMCVIPDRREDRKSEVAVKGPRRHTEARRRWPGLRVGGDKVSPSESVSGAAQGQSPGKA
jgi:hypothetical protein